MQCVLLYTWHKGGSVECLPASGSHVLFHYRGDRHFGKEVPCPRLAP